MVTRVLVTLVLVMFFATWNSPVYGASENDEKTAQVGLCGFIVGGFVIAGGAYIAYKLYKCAEKLLYPPPPPPPPPATTNSPPRTNKLMSIIASAGSSSFVVSDPLNMDWIALRDISQNGWYDWEGNLYTLAFGGSITNVPIGTNTGWFQSSPDLKTWTNSPVSIIVYVSETPFGVQTNVVTVVYDNERIPFATNWSSLTVSGGNSYSTPIASVTGVPVRTNRTKQFYRTLVTP